MLDDFASAPLQQPQQYRRQAGLRLPDQIWLRDAGVEPLPTMRIW